MANPFFDAAFYLAQNPDLVTSGVTAATAEQHYNDYGASEGRAPNPWFDANAYLLANTDLISGGVTMATALAHFAAYGADEGRIFNNNPDLASSNFSAKAYATANKDVAAALGITDLNAITPLQHNELMAHYLAYGAAEGRKGVDASFADAVAVAPIVVNLDPAVNNGLTVGTSGNDTFVWNAPADSGLSPAPAAMPSINGLDGVDTLKITAFGAALTKAIELVSVENITAALTTDSTLKIANGADIQSISMTGKHALTVDFGAGVSGTSDVLAVSLKDIGSSLTTNGIEVINATLGEDAGTFTLASNKVSGTGIDFNLAGGKAGNMTAVTVESTGSGTLKTADIDGSSFAGNLTIAVGTQLANVSNINITTGAGDDTINAAGGTATVNAGAGNDIINAHAGIDILTGGAGNDTFKFAAVADAVVQLTKAADGTTVTGIKATDVITDFTAGDKLDIVGWAVSADGIYGTLGSVANGVLTFASGNASGTLYDAVSLLAIETLSCGAQVAFQFGEDTYLFMGDGVTTFSEDDSLIKLVGVTATDLDLSAPEIVYAA